MTILLSLLLAMPALQASPAKIPATVLLIPLETTDDKASQDFQKAIPLTSPENGVRFDIDGDGLPEQVAWTQADAPVAFLVLDKNENGRIDDGTEIVGTRVIEVARSAVAALSMLRKRMDPGAALSGAVRHGDTLYEKLLLWRDANHNGISEPDELRPARELVTGIGLGYTGFSQRDGHGNLFRFKGWMELRTAPGLNESEGGSEHRARVRQIYEVALQQR
jgi:hypothetical protein